MARRPPHFAHLKKNYLFPEIERRRAQFLKENPAAKVISLGVGDTVRPPHSLDHIGFKKRGGEDGDG